MKVVGSIGHRHEGEKGVHGGATRHQSDAKILGLLCGAYSQKTGVCEAPKLLSQLHLFFSGVKLHMFG